MSAKMKRYGQDEDRLKSRKRARLLGVLFQQGPPRVGREVPQFFPFLGRSSLLLATLP
jgi:hypothetical protein